MRVAAFREPRLERRECAHATSLLRRSLKSPTKSFRHECREDGGCAGSLAGLTPGQTFVNQLLALGLALEL